MIEILRHRRSIRQYTAEPVSPAARDLLVEGLLPADLEFRAVVKREDLNGLLFHEVWSDEDE